MARTVLATAVLAGVLASGAAVAGTKGGLYDFSYFLNQGHPFSGLGTTAYRPGPYAAPAAPPGTPYPQALPQAPSPYYGAPPAYGTAAPSPYSYGATAAATAPRAVRPGRAERGDDGTFSGMFSRFYVRAGAGLDYPDDIDDSGGGARIDIELDDGFVGEFAFGTYLFEDVRTELELGYRQTDINKASSGGAVASPDGDLKVATAMLNAFYDIRFGWPVYPYVGAGIGAAFIDTDDVTVGGATSSGDSNTEFAYQGIVGIGWNVWDNWDVTLDYRYLDTTGDTVRTQSVTGGVRYAF